MLSILGKQLNKPSGFLGKIVAKMMDKRNKSFYEQIIIDLDLKDGEKLFEIGYGPGMGIEMILSKKPNVKIYGTDFSKLMYKQAVIRNQKFVDNGTVNLEFGDLLSKDYSEKFDKIYCVNVVYFWKDLDLAFSKIHNMVNTGGRFCIFMYDEKFIEQLNFENFYKYSISTVEQKLLEAGFKSVDYKFDGGYFIKAYN